MNLPSELLPFVIDTPDRPAVIFHGETVFLRFEDEARQIEIFASLGIDVPADLPLPYNFPTPIGEVAIIGTIWNNDSVRGPDSEDGLPTFSVPTTKPGWHVNLLPTT